MSEIEGNWVDLELDNREVDLGGHPHFMAKEMAEQPDVLERLTTVGRAQILELARAVEESYGTFFMGCGTASYAAMTGSYLFSRIASHHVNFVVGSEFKYHEHFLTPRSLAVALSQSGETADVIEAMLAARKRGSRLGALVMGTSDLAKELRAAGHKDEAAQVKSLRKPSVAAWALNRLGLLTGERRYEEAATSTLGLFWPQIERQPSGFAVVNKYVLPRHRLASDAYRFGAVVGGAAGRLRERTHQ